ncbi:MAG TPA: hypothetical protein VG273_27065 [Bryobacteraceae bacterium]|jgi:hypothetical protein|nr:hypothetical protein [Bryobacteraceae bacterium]
MKSLAIALLISAAAVQGLEIMPGAGAELRQPQLAAAYGKVALAYVRALRSGLPLQRIRAEPFPRT